MTPDSCPTAPRLGDLEVRVLEHLWAVESASAKSVHDAVGSTRGIGLNTIQSTLDRLHRKQLLVRRKISRAFHYSARVSRSSLLSAMVAEAALRLGKDRSLAMSALIEAAERLDETALDELERLIEVRRTLREGGADD